MDDNLKALMQELGDAINASLSDSDRMATAIGEIKRAGYDVYLVMESTIGFSERDPAERDLDEPETPEARKPPQSATPPSTPPPKQPGKKSEGKLKLTSSDKKFFRALRITVEEDGGKNDKKK